jgi:hypothetical protein
MSESRFYEQRQYVCATCGHALLWLKRSDQADSFVVFHSDSSCTNSGKAFYPPALTLTEIKGRIVDNAFLPEFAEPSRKERKRK